MALPTLDVMLDWALIVTWLRNPLLYGRAALSISFCLATNVVTWRQERAAWKEAQEPAGSQGQAKPQPLWRDVVQLLGLGMALTAVDMVRDMLRGVLPTPAQRRRVMRLKLVEVSVEAGTQMVLQLCATGW